MPALVEQSAYPAVHHASLIDPALHSPATLELTDLKMSRTVIEYAVDTVIEAVDYAMGRPESSTRGRSLARHHRHADFVNFVNNVLYKAEVKFPVLLASLVYIHRAKPHLQIALEQWACERVFMGALILANKFCNDSTLKNIHWALCTGVFGKRDIGRIEREFLDVLDYDLNIHESDLLAHHDAVMTLVQPARAHARSHAHHHQHHHHHHSVKFTRTAAEQEEDERTLGSTWSNDSSLDSDDSDMACSSRSVSPMPVTPHHLPVAVPAVVTVSPTKPSSPASPDEAGPKVVVVSQHAPHHHRLSSALQLLKLFPVPHFHHSHSGSSSSSREVSPVSASSVSSSATAASVAAAA